MQLFAFFGLWPAVLGVGIGAVAIPVIIHLINRRRFKIVPWAAMRFLLAAQKQTRKRMRVEQLFLLLVRMAILALLVFAMASVMPWAEDIWAHWNLAEFGKTVAPRSYRIHHLIVMDASLSMNQKVGDDTAFEIARRKVIEKIQDNPSGDGYTVLLLKDSPTWLVGEVSQDGRKVMREVETVRPSQGNASLPSAFNMVIAKLNEARQRFPVQAVYFFTDMQRSTWASAAPNQSDFNTAADGKEDKKDIDKKEPERKGESDKNPYLEIQKLATTIFVDAGPKKDAANLAVVHLEFVENRVPYITPKNDLMLRASVKNFSGEQKNGIRAELFIGKAMENKEEPPLQMRFNGQETKDISPHSQATFDFKAQFPSAGTYAVQVKISGDALEQDDTRAAVITVRETIPVLLVKGDDSDAAKTDTQDLAWALNPFSVGSEQSWMPIRPRVVGPTAFKNMKDDELKAYDCIFWCNVGEFDLNHVSRLDSHLRRGGGFIVSLGDKAAEHVDTYKSLLYKGGMGLLPAELLEKIKVPSKDYSFFLGAEDFRIAPLNAFEEGKERMTLRTARFREYVNTNALKEAGRPILRFMTEIQSDAKEDEKTKQAGALLPRTPPAALLDWNPPLSRTRHQARYRGKVMLFTSTFNRDWTNWPNSPSFLPLIHEITRLALPANLREQGFNVGSILEGTLPGDAEVDVTLHYPEKYKDIYKELKPTKFQSQVVDDVNVFRWNAVGGTDLSGIYRVTTPQGQEFPFAVNTPASSADSESDLARVEEKKLRDLYPNWNFKIVGDAREVTISDTGDQSGLPDTPQPVGPFFANVALLLVLGLLFLEIALAWHFGHYTTPDPNAAPPVSPFTSTLVAALIAVCAVGIFAFGATILIHHFQTGDFLGFLPDLLRNWVESALEVPPPPPGEGTNWRYETMPFLFGLPAETWWVFGVCLAAIVVIIFTYKAEAPNVALLYKFLLGALRLFLILTVLWLLGRPQLQFAREGYPDMILLIDDTRSMGEQDNYQDAQTQERAKKLTEELRVKLTTELPGKIEAISEELKAKVPNAKKDAEGKAEFEAVKQRLDYWVEQQKQLAKNTWRPSRLQLAQAILAQPEPRNWLKKLSAKYKSRIHIFHLDIHGRAIKLRDPKGDAGDIDFPPEPGQFDRASKAIALLEPVGDDSRLGMSVRQVIDHYRGSSLFSLVMFTDGVTTRDETIRQIADYAHNRQVPLFFVGLGDELQLRDLKLHDLYVDDPIYLGDTAIIEVRLEGKGYKDLTVPVVLKVREKGGKETKLKTQMIRVDPTKVVKIKFADTPKEKGRRTYIVEVDPPKAEGNEKPIPPGNLRQERTIEVVDVETIHVLYIEGQPRYEYRYLKFLLEREAPNEKKKKSIEMKVLQLDADDDFAKVDDTALENFPASLDELNKYDVIFIGDCDPNHKKWRNHLKDIVKFAKGENEKGQKADKRGGGVLFIAGALNNPHRYKGTPLQEILPVEPLQEQPPADIPRIDRMRPVLTPDGRNQQMFKFNPDDNESNKIWQNLTPLYWNSSKYKSKPRATVWAVHPSEKAEFKDPNTQDDRHPLVVSQLVGTGRSLFYGFDETWRWRLRDDEPKFNSFWIQTVRYLSRGRSTRTTLQLDKQDGYRVGEDIKISVRFPDSNPAGAKGGDKTEAKVTEVKVTVLHLPPDAKDHKGEKGIETKTDSIQLTKSLDKVGEYTGTLHQAKKGKYRFRLLHPDVSKNQPDEEQPNAETLVELPPGELDNLRMNAQELIDAAKTTQGGFFTIENANEVLEKLPPPPKNPITAQVDPTLLWNNPLSFFFVLFLITSEWILRKMKHLL